MQDTITVDQEMLGLGNTDVPMPTPGEDYFAKPPTKRRNAQGQFDITTPPGLLDKDTNYVAVLTTGENRHPDEDAIIEHYARQLAAKREGTYNPLEDAPVILRDLLPTLFLVVNKVFHKDEVTVGGNTVIKEYVDKLKRHIDFDIIPVMCGKPIVLPLHPNVPVEHRDPIFNAQMQSFYKQHDKGAKDMLDRIIRAREESEKKMEEQRAKEKAAREAQKSSSSSTTAPNNEEDEEFDESKPEAPEGGWESTAISTAAVGTGGAKPAKIKSGVRSAK